MVKLLSGSFIRFLAVGMINTLIGLAIIFTFMNLLHFSYWTSTLMGNIIGAAVSYVLNRKFTFKSTKNQAGSALRFILVILACYFIAYGIGLRAVHLALAHLPAIPHHFENNLAVVIGMGLYTILNYFGQKKLVF
jgi:putative flippase GtrA